MRNIVDGRDDAEVRYRESHEDHRSGEKFVRERAEKGYYVLAFCSWLMSFSEFMYGKMCSAYMTSCAAAGGEVLFGKMRAPTTKMWTRTGQDELPT
jgi:hypothetical protein